jgi:transposase
MIRRYALRDDQWDRIEDLLPGREGAVGVTAKDNRLFVEAVLYRYRAGIPWRDLPERFGDFRVVHTRFSRWTKTGVWGPPEKSPSFRPNATAKSPARTIESSIRRAI